MPSFRRRAAIAAATCVLALTIVPTAARAADEPIAIFQAFDQDYADVERFVCDLAQQGYSHVQIARHRSRIRARSGGHDISRSTTPSSKDTISSTNAGCGSRKNARGFSNRTSSGACDEGDGFKRERGSYSADGHALPRDAGLCDPLLQGLSGANRPHAGLARGKRIASSYRGAPIRIVERGPDAVESRRRLPIQKGESPAPLASRR